MLRPLALLASLLVALLQLPRQANAQTIDNSNVVWSGVYVGAVVGQGWMDLSVVDGGTPIANPPYGAFACGPALTGNYCDKPFEFASRGLLGGLHIGINWQASNVVFGLEGDVGWINAEADKTLIRPFDDRDFVAASVAWYATTTAKLGLTFDRALYYVRGGAALARVHVAAADMDLSGGGFGIYQGSMVNSKELLSGWTLGAGVEYAINSRLSFRAEYLYMDFGSFAARSSDGDIYNHDVALHTARLGLSLRLSQ